MAEDRVSYVDCRVRVDGQGVAIWQCRKSVLFRFNGKLKETVTRDWLKE